MAIDNGLERIEYMFNIVVRKVFFSVCHLSMYFSTGGDTEFSDWLTQNVTNSGIGYLCPVYGIGKRIPFSKQCRYATNYMSLYVNNYYF